MNIEQTASYFAVNASCFAVIGAAIVLGIGTPTSAETQVVVIPPSKDNTLIEPMGAEANSNGAGDGIFVGRTYLFADFTLRRGVIAFDVAAAVPSGATIESALLTLRMVHTVSGVQQVGLHPLLADWGEGASLGFGGPGAPAEPGDATWVNRYHPGDPWATPGGDFVATASASTAVDGIGDYSWTSLQLASDVQGFLDDPAGNFGWIIIGNEASPRTAKRFASREHTTEAWRPALTIAYTLASDCPADLNDDDVVDVLDMLALFAAWGPNPGHPADLNGDDVVDVLDMLSLFAAWGDCP